jgi:acetolactate synthase I/II/III large subunit
MNDMEKLATDIATHGNRTVFGITGSGATLTLLDELEKLGVRAVRTYFEGSAVLMAGTVGRLTGRAGVAYGIKGPGLANMVPGLAASWLDACPVVAIVEAYPPDSKPDKAHKRLDHRAITRAVTKGTRFLSKSGPAFCDLAAWAESEVPGPVVLEIASGSTPAQLDIPVQENVTCQADALLRQVEKANRPVVIAGTLAIRKGWGEALAGLCLPVFTTAAAKGVVDETASMAAGVYTGVGLELTPERRLLSQADLVIGLGVRPNELLATKPFICPAINVDPVVVPGVDAFEFAAVATDIPQSLWQLLATKKWGLDILEEFLLQLDDVILQDFLPGQAFSILAKYFGRSVRMIMDTGYFCTIGEHIWRTSCADLCLLSGQGRYMGTVVPMAIGAAIHDPATSVVAVAGDGGIGMYIGEIRLAVEYGLPILFVLMSDGRFGSIATRAIKDGLTQAPLGIANPSWLDIMEGFGLPAWLAGSPEELQAALRSWNSSDGPGYLEIAFGPELYERMCTNIR